MPVSVNMLPKGEVGNSPVDAISKAIGIVNSVYGIKADSAKLDQYKSELDKTNLLNKQAQAESDKNVALRSELSKPDSPATLGEKQVAGAHLSAIGQIMKIDPNNTDHPLNKLMQTVNDPNTSGIDTQNILNSPEVKQLSDLAGNQAKAEAGGIRLNGLVEQKRDQMENNIHQKVVNRVINDKQLGQKLNQYQNLSNAMSNVVNSDTLTPQQIDEFQQAVRANLGIKGSSGVGEREHTFINSLGLNSDRMKQFITGDPAQIAQDNKLVAHIKNLASLEMKNIEAQSQKRINAVSAGAGTLYKKRPDLKSDIDQAVQSTKEQYAPTSTSAGSQPPGGHLTVQQNGHTYNWNSDTGQYE